MLTKGSLDDLDDATLEDSKQMLNLLKPWKIFPKIMVSDFFPRCKLIWVVQRRIFMMIVLFTKILLKSSLWWSESYSP